MGPGTAFCRCGDGRLTTVRTGPLVWFCAAVAQLVERVLGKDEVMGPNPISSSMQVWQAVGLADNRIVMRWQGRLWIAVLRKVF